MTCSTCRSVEYTCRPACDPNNQKVEMAFCGKVASQTTCGLALYAFSRGVPEEDISLGPLHVFLRMCEHTHTCTRHATKEGASVNFTEYLRIALRNLFYI